MNIVIFGHNGQIAIKLKEIYPHARTISSNECNFLYPNLVANFLNNLKDKTNIIINAAAYTKVDLAETEQQNAFLINVESVSKLAEYCKVNNILFIHYSTDYVFDGIGFESFKEDNMINLNPLCYYGKTKLLSEKAILESKCKHYIIRTSWVYSENGNNFVKTILKLMQTKNEIFVVNDQIGSPTYATDIAHITKLFIDKNPEFGIYHFTNGEFISWYNFACSIKKIANKIGYNLKIKTINPINSSKQQTAVIRPFNSRLDKTKIEKKLNIKIENYNISLLKCLQNIYNDCFLI